MNHTITLTTRQERLDHAIATALQHIPIKLAVSLDREGFVIIDHGNRMAVYDRHAYEHGQAPGGLLPPHPITGALVGYVFMDGVFHPATSTLEWRELPERDQTCALSVAADYVISHRPALFTCSYRPPGQHVPVAQCHTLEAAKQAAQLHCDLLP